MNVNVSSGDPIHIATESFTICLRFHLEILGSAGVPERGTVMHIPGLLHLMASYPNREVRHILSSKLKSNSKSQVISLSSNLNYQTMPVLKCSVLTFGPTSFILKHPDDGFRPFAPHKWNNLCLSFNTRTDLIRVILVAHIMFLFKVDIS